MSMLEQPKSGRQEALDQLDIAGRAMSDAIVLFHARAAEIFGMGASDWKALGLIAQHGPISHRDLMSRLGLKPASVTNILDRLQAAGWVARTRSADDGRGIKVSVNDEKIAAFRQRVFGPLLSRLNEVYDGYDAHELALIAGAFARIAKAQAAAAAELQG
jgi:DNA-binding MarR family transcriptional regulator